MKFKNIILKVLIFIAAMISAEIAFILVTYFLKFILIDILGKWKFLTTILSWPVSYSWYATVIIITVAPFISMSICSKFDSLSGNHAQSWTFLICGIISCIYNAIITFSANGFSLSALIIAIIGIVAYIVAFSEAIGNAN